MEISQVKWRQCVLGRGNKATQCLRNRKRFMMAGLESVREKSEKRSKQTRARSCKLLKAMVRSLTFLVRVMGSYGGL